MCQALTTDSLICCILASSMEGTWYVPEQPSDDEESKAEKKEKKDGKALAKKASLLELFNAQQEKPKETKEQPKDELTDKKHEEKVEREPDAELDKTEQNVVSEQLVDDRLETVEAELETAPSDSGEETSAIAAATFLKKVGDKIDKGDALNDQMLAEATAEVIDELGIPLDALAEEMEPEDASVFEEPELSEKEPDIEDIDEDDDTVPPTPPVPPASSLPPPPLVPPVSPGGHPAGGPAYYSPVSGSNVQHNTAPATPNVMSTKEESKHSHIKYVLAGGLLGYLLGRRRGRIKTEKRLLSIQKKLETQVGELQEKLVDKEGLIRRLAIKHRETLNQVDRKEAQELVHRERTKRGEALKIYANGLHKQPEKLGKFALLPNASPERPAATETMSDKQLIEVAKNIKIEGVSLDIMYQKGRIELSNLKTIVGEFLGGGSYEVMLAKSLKPEQYETLQQVPIAQNFETHDTPKLAELLPEISGLRERDNLKFGAEKETHLAVRVGMVAGAITLVVVIAVVVALWMLGEF